MQKIDCIILAGGLGTRLKEVIDDRPKILAPILGRAFIDILLKKLYESGSIARVIIAVGYRAHQIIAHLEKNPSPLPVVYSFEDTPLGTGGALLNALEHVSGEQAFAINGDSYTDIALNAFLEQHLKSHALVSMVCKAVVDKSRYGCLEIDQANLKITSFQEKSEDGDGWINAGIYLINRSQFLSIFSNYKSSSCSLEKDLFPELVKKSLLFAFFTSQPFIDIGTPQSYVAAQTFF